jgi:NitT/TauT family transport system substrate-binding protein
MLIDCHEQKSKVKIAVRLAVFLLLSFVVIARAEARKVKVAMPGVGMALIAYIAANEKRYYHDEGLDVELIWMRAATANQALIAGNVEFATVAGAPLPAILSGAPLLYVFSSFERPLHGLYSRADIHNVKELMGKKVAASSLGSGPDSQLREILKRNRLDPNRDVTILGIGVNPTRYTALTAGTVDAALLTAPFTFLALENGFSELVAFVKEDLVELHGAIVLRRDLLREDSTLVEKFVRGTLKGLLYARLNRGGTIPILARSMKTDNSLAAKTYDWAKPAMTQFGTVSKEIQEKALEHVVERMSIKEPPPLEKIFDFSLTRKIRAELEAKAWKPL